MNRLLTLCLTASLSLAFNSNAAGQGKDFIDQPYVEVTGEADSLVIPNLIYLSITVSEKDVKNKSTVEELETKMFETLSGLGIDIAKKLTVSDLLSNFRNYWLKKSDVIKSKSFELEVSTAAMAADVMVALENIGIANVGISRLEHSEIKSIENDLRMRAVLDARRKAEALASPLQQLVGRAIHIVDFTKTHPVHSDLGNQGEMFIFGNRLSQTDSITFKKLRVSKGVTVAFILK